MEGGERSAAAAATAATTNTVAEAAPANAIRQHLHRRLSPLQRCEQITAEGEGNRRPVRRARRPPLRLRSSHGFPQRIPLGRNAGAARAHPRPNARVRTRTSTINEEDRGSVAGDDGSGEVPSFHGGRVAAACAGRDEAEGEGVRGDVDGVESADSGAGGGFGQESEGDAVSVEFFHDGAAAVAGAYYGVGGGGGIVEGAECQVGTRAD
mmetsp:Transcript_30429/g.64218  ORF Transcript_30429/g.64218 Transcript_30429/m.64218 type:complete len:209 (+) Transcript_30429:451-1077(+)